MEVFSKQQIVAQQTAAHSPVLMFSRDTVLKSQKNNQETLVILGACTSKIDKIRRLYMMDLLLLCLLTLFMCKYPARQN